MRDLAKEASVFFRHAVGNKRRLVRIVSSHNFVPNQSGQEAPFGVAVLEIERVDCSPLTSRQDQPTTSEEEDALAAASERALREEQSL
jgi:hypothetical protein